jgi:hypothetical protein
MAAADAWRAALIAGSAPFADALSAWTKVEAGKQRRFAAEPEAPYPSIVVTALLDAEEVDGVFTKWELTGAALNVSKKPDETPSTTYRLERWIGRTGVWSAYPDAPTRVPWAGDKAPIDFSLDITATAQTGLFAGRHPLVEVKADGAETPIARFVLSADEYALVGVRRLVSALGGVDEHVALLIAMLRMATEGHTDARAIWTALKRDCGAKCFLVTPTVPRSARTI